MCRFFWKISSFGHKIGKHKTIIKFDFGKIIHVGAPEGMLKQTQNEIIGDHFLQHQASRKKHSFTLHQRTNHKLCRAQEAGKFSVIRKLTAQKLVIRAARA